MDKKKLTDAISKALEGKGKKKFTQSVELIINMRGLDFTKTENRINLDIVLPKGKGGKELKSCVIGDASIVDEAKKAGADLVILPHEIAGYAAKEKSDDLADNYLLIAQPSQMAAVAKTLGQFLGKKGKLPKPILGNVADLITRSKNSVRVATKGKYLPTVQALVGTEKMSPEAIFENADAVYEEVKNKVTEGNIRSMYVKLTMGTPVRVV